jgi:hypothetical protein
MTDRQPRRREHNPFDLPHIGALYRLIYTSRGVQPSNIAEYCHVNQSSINRFVHTGVAREDKFAQYVAALKSRDVVPKPLPLLTNDQETILTNIYKRYRPDFDAARETLEATLNLISLKDIHPDFCTSKELADLVKKLETTDRPAMITDPLWHDHAINGTLCNLFNIKRERNHNGNLVLRDFFKQWAAWHSLGIKFMRTSPTRKAYKTTDDKFLPGILQYFFEDERTYPYLFTTHFRCLIDRLYRLSVGEKYPFRAAWRNVISFNLTEDPGTIARTIFYDGNPLLFELIKEDIPITLPGGYVITYSLSLFEPVGPFANKIIDAIQDTTIHFAADYDEANDFHVNTWSELTLK